MTITCIMEDVTVNKGQCSDCRHYKEAYCNLMDELVEPQDNCGMYDGGEE